MSRKNQGAIFLPIKFLLFTGMLTFLSCSPSECHIKNGMYYWKSSEYYLPHSLDTTLTHLKVSKLYVKLFEVDLDSILGPVPASVNEIHVWDLDREPEPKKDRPHREVVPVVFIRNEVLKYPKLDIHSLVNQILKFVDGKTNSGGYRVFKYNELQIDCDWTESTAQRYHDLIAAIKQKFKGQVSITLRLYPYKFREKMGVPPADRAVLLCYNLMAPNQSGSKNSVLDIPIMHDYLDDVDRYPIPIDVALPIYRMAYLFRNNAFLQTVDWSPEQSNIKHDSLGNGVYRLLENQVENETFYRVGDIIEVEEVSKELLDDAIRLVHQEVELHDTATISFFHLDHELIQHQGVSHLAAIYKYWH